MSGFFVTGTDTGIGKTVVAAAVVAVLRRHGVDAAPMKAVQTGAVPPSPRLSPETRLTACSGSGLGRTGQRDGVWRSPDLDFCLEAAGLAPSEQEYADMAPYCLRLAASPHLAAAAENVRVSPERILDSYSRLAQRHAMVVVEGAGGILVPLNDEAFMLDLIRLLGLPVLLVARAGLGTLNHTLLSLRELERAGATMAGVVFNDAQPSAWGDIERDNVGVMERMGGVPVLGRLPHLEDLERLRRQPKAFAEAVSAGVPVAALLAAGQRRRYDAAAYARLDAVHLWHPYTEHTALNAVPFPLIVAGRGPYLFDSEGRRYFDAIASWWACNLGHSHPRLVRAMTRQAAELQHSILGNLSHPRAVELAERLSACFGGEARRVFFASDGASAVEAALKIAVQYWRNAGKPKRQKFAALENGYHGDTLGAVSVGFVREFHEPFERLLFPVWRAEAPCCYPCVHGKKPETCRQECFASMCRILDEHGEELAAVIVEPMCQGAAGMRIYAAGYLRELEACCRCHGVLLIADEIAMGYGRTGRMFAFEHAGVDPDIVCLGKSLAGGYLPMSATIVKDSIFQAFRDAPGRDGAFYHGHTFAGNPVAAAVALETLAVYQDDDIVGRARALGARLRQELDGLAGAPGVRNVRCLGAVGAVELGLDRTAGNARAHAVCRYLLERGVLLRPLGPVLYFMPPLITPVQVLADAVSLLREALAACPAPGGEESQPACPPKADMRSPPRRTGRMEPQIDEPQNAK